MVGRSVKLIGQGRSAKMAVGRSKWSIGQVKSGHQNGRSAKMVGQAKNGHQNGQSVKIGRSKRSVGRNGRSAKSGPLLIEIT